MTLLLIALAVVAFLVLLGRGVLRKPSPEQLRQILTTGGAIIALGSGALLSLKGNLVVGAPLIVMGLGALFPGMRQVLGGGAGGPSEVETTFLRMQLDRATGAIDGEMKRGAFAGRRLSELSEAELRRALLEVAGQDRDAAALLHAYVTRRFARAAGDGQAGGAPPGAAHAGMSEEEALAVLGLERGATADEVRAAHKRLMVKLHPDQGGTSWLAAKLNAARERLIGKG